MSRWVCQDCTVSFGNDVEQDEAKPDCPNCLENYSVVPE